MARRMYGQRSMYGGYAPPAAIVTAVPTLNPAGLTAAYEWMSVDRLTSLKLAHEWYAEAICPANGPSPLLYGAPLNPAQQKSYDIAVKIKAVGDSTPYPAEKATFLEKAIRMYEGIWGGRGLPKVDEPVDPGQSVTNVQTVLGNFNEAFKGFGVSFRMTFNADREFLQGEVLIPREELNLMVGEPPLKAILAEATTVAKVASIATNVDGEQQLDGQKFMETLPLVLCAVYTWAAGSDKVMKPVGKPVVVVMPKGPKAPKAAGSAATATPAVKYRPYNRIKVVGPLPSANGKRGTALGLVKDGQSVRDLQAALEAAGLKGYTGWVITVTVSKGTVQLV